MGRRRFDHLVLELSLALKRPAPRFALWLRIHETGLDPEELSRDEVADFCGAPLAEFLAEQGLLIGPRSRRRLERSVRRYDPSIPTPEEHFARF